MYSRPMLCSLERGLENVGCSLEGNVIAGPHPLDWRADQDQPYRPYPDKGLGMALHILARNHPGAKELMEQRSGPGRVIHDEGYVTDGSNHAWPPLG